jgi:hypothetical protein
MRPYITFPDDTLEAVRYGADRADECIGGTIPRLTPEKIAAVLDASAPTGVRMRTSVLHITLSAPEGFTLPRLVWQGVIKHVLMRLGIDPETHPWIAFRHSDKNCDHVHIPASRTDFFGRPGGKLPRDLDVLCSEIHRDLALRLGFEVPDYPVLSPHPRLHSRAPKRRAMKPKVAALHDAVGKILVEQRPDTVEDLAKYLPAPFTLDHDGTYPAFRIDGRSPSLADLKPDLTWQSLLARLSHVAAIRRTLGALREMSFVLPFLNPASRARLRNLRKGFQHDQSKQVRTASSHQRHLRSEPRDVAQAGRDEAALGLAGRLEGSGDGSGPSGPRGSSRGHLHDDRRNPSPAVSTRSAVARDGRDGLRLETVPRPDGASPSLTVGAWAADLWGAALRLARRPTIRFGRRSGRATVRFADATRIEVDGTEVALGHVGTGDLASPRTFAAALSGSDAAWRIDAALTPSFRQKRPLLKPRDAFILANLDADTLRRARHILDLTVKDPLPLFLSAEDPAIRHFPDAPLLSTCPEDNELLAAIQSGRAFIVAAAEADPEDPGPEPF